MKKKILLVDDEKIILESLALDLSQQGYLVDKACCAEEALTKLESDNTYNLLITDLIMEGMGGMELLKRAKKINQDMAVFLLTGFADLSSAVEAMRAGAEDYLVKPCESTELLLRVERVLHKVELRRKIRYYENILPVCAVCKRIRDDTGREPGTGEWVSLDKFLQRKTGVELNPGYCEECARKRGQKIGTGQSGKS